MKRNKKEAGVGPYFKKRTFKNRPIWSHCLQRSIVQPTRNHFCLRNIIKREKGYFFVSKGGGRCKGGGGKQCDQTDRLLTIFGHLGTTTIDNLTNNIKISQSSSKFCQILNKPWNILLEMFYNFAKLAKFRQIWSHWRQRRRRRRRMIHHFYVPAIDWFISSLHQCDQIWRFIALWATF